MKILIRLFFLRILYFLMDVVLCSEKLYSVGLFVSEFWKKGTI